MASSTRKLTLDKKAHHGACTDQRNPYLASGYSAYQSALGLQSCTARASTGLGKSFS